MELFWVGLVTSFSASYVFATLVSNVPLAIIGSVTIGFITAAGCFDIDRNGFCSW